MVLLFCRSNIKDTNLKVITALVALLLSKQLSYAINHLCIVLYIAVVVSFTNNQT